MLAPLFKLDFHKQQTSLEEEMSRIIEWTIRRDAAPTATLPQRLIEELERVARKDSFFTDQVVRRMNILRQEATISRITPADIDTMRELGTLVTDFLFGFRVYPSPHLWLVIQRN